LPEYSEWLKVEAQGREISAIKAGEAELPISDYMYKTDPYDHQQKSFELSKALPAYGYFMEMGCVDGETEFMSPKGWVKIKDYSGQQVLQFDLITETSNFVEPIEYINLPNQEFYHIKHSRGVDQMLCSQHDVVYRKRDKVGSLVKQNVEEFYSSLENNRWKYLPSTFKHNTETALTLTDEALRVQVAVQADGHFRNKTNSLCVIRIKKLRKKQRLRKLLANANIEYVEKPQQDDYINFEFIAPIKIKTYDERYWSASYDQLKIISQECLPWAPKNKQLCY